MAQKLPVQYIRLYTDGSAALKLESAASQNSAPQSAPQRKVKCKKIFVDPVAILSIAVALSMLIMMCVGFSQLHQARRQVAIMETYVEHLQAEHERLSAEYRAGYDLEDIRRSALELNMIPAEQAAYVTIDIPAETEPEPVTELTIWERIGTFFSGLFA